MSELAAPAVAAEAITRVTLAVDSSPTSAHVAAYVRDLLRPGMHVSLVSVAENPRVLTPQLRFVDAVLDAAREELRRDARAALERAAGTVSESGAAVDSRLIDLSREGGIVADALVADAHTHRAQLLVLGARQRHGMLRWLDASVSQPVTRDAHCSMLIVPERFERRAGGPLARIMFALDGSPASLHALHCGLQFAAPQTELLATYVVDRAVRLFDIAPVKLLEGAYVAEGERALGHAATVLARYPNASKTALLTTRAINDDVAHALVREATRRHADLLVVGTHGRRGLTRWLLGSVARRVAHLSEVPVLLVRPVP